MAVGIAPVNRQIQSLTFVPNAEIQFHQTAWHKGSGIKRLYHADNIDVLHALLKDENVCGKVTVSQPFFHRCRGVPVDFPRSFPQLVEKCVEKMSFTHISAFSFVQNPKIPHFP